MACLNPQFEFIHLNQELNDGDYIVRERERERERNLNDQFDLIVFFIRLVIKFD